MPTSLIPTLLRLAKRFWYVAPILAMAGYTLALRHQVSVRDQSLDRAKVTQTQLEGRNRLVQAALDAATARIVDNNARIEKAAADLAAQRVRAAAELATLSERYTRTQATVRALEASSARTPADPCRPSDLALDALENL